MQSPRQTWVLMGHQAVFIKMDVLMAEFVNQIIVMQESVLTREDEFGFVKLCFQAGCGGIRKEEVEQHARG